MDYKEALNYIENTAKFGMNLGLDRINKLLEYMGNPEKKLKCIHIAGTNGKGSVTSMISRILIEEGLKVGVYTSPYLQRFTERITINGSEISKDDVARLTSFIEPIVSRVISEGYEHPTEFEIITAMMFKYFEEKNVDIAVIEVGLGGRLDSTNVVNPLVSVITTISLDHMAVLGNTLGEIACEKAGIIKNNGLVVVYPQEKEAFDVINTVCIERNASLIPVSRDGIYLKSFNLDGQVFDIDFGDDKFTDLSIKLLGEYQLLNAKTAIEAVWALGKKAITVTRESIYRGVKNTIWPGRLEVMRKNPLILLDGAHNIQGITCLKAALLKYFQYKRLILVMGILKDKQVEDMCRTLMPLADAIITVTPASPRAMKSEELKKIASLYCHEVSGSSNIEDAVEKGLIAAGSEDLLLFCGSLYMIGYVRTLIENME
jgi:folylpolyglutamate synthase/dihydrofolate synthase